MQDAAVVEVTHYLQDLCCVVVLEQVVQTCSVSIGQVLQPELYTCTYICS